MRISETKTITAENQFTKRVFLNGTFQVDITGLSDSTVTLQRTRDGGDTWIDVQSFTEDVFYRGEVGNTQCQYRLGVKTGDFGTDDPIVFLEA